jgi:hypothetical protein
MTISGLAGSTPLIKLLLTDRYITPRALSSFFSINHGSTSTQIGRGDSRMRQQQSKPQHRQPATYTDTVTLNLTISGAREHLMELLDRMDQLEGFSVLDGSFTAKMAHKETHH